MKKCILKRGNIKATILSYGAILHELWVPDKNTTPVNVIVNCKDTAAYKADQWFRSAVIGPYAGRLSNPVPIGKYNHTIKHTSTYPLLHGGAFSWAKQNWELQQTSATTADAFLSCLESEKEFPGNITVKVHYRLLKNGLHISYNATTTAPTPLNMTNHAYFNLGNNSPIAEHELELFSDTYLETNKELLPTGKLLPTDGSVYNFKSSQPIGKTAFDTYFVAQNPLKARCYHPNTGIQMDVYSDQFGVVVFRPPHFEALCFETQAPSDSPKFIEFPGGIFTPAQPYVHETKWLFSVR